MIILMEGIQIVYFLKNPGSRDYLDLRALAIIAHLIGGFGPSAPLSPPLPHVRGCNKIQVPKCRDYVLCLSLL